MRSFDEIKNNVMIYNLKLVTEKYKELRRENITEEEKNDIRKVMKQMQDNIDNIEEITIITIGSEINKFITLIQDNYWDNRDDYYNKDTEHPNEAEVIIAKQRNGAIGTINLVWKPDITKFVNMAR